MGGQDQVGRGRDTAAIQLPRLLLLSPLPPPHNHGFTPGTAFPFTDHTPHSPKATPLPPPVPLPLPKEWGTAVGRVGVDTKERKDE